MNVSILKKLQALLGVEVDGLPGAQTYKALAIALSIDGKFTKEQLIAEIQKAIGINPDGLETDALFQAATDFIEARAVNTSTGPTGDFVVLEIPKSGVIPTDGPVGDLLATGVIALLGKFRGVGKSKGTTLTGATSLLGGITMLIQGWNTQDPTLASHGIVGGLSAIVAGIGLLMARDSNVSDEKAGAKKLPIA